MRYWRLGAGLVHFKVFQPYGYGETITAPGPLPVRVYSMIDETTKDELLWEGQMNVAWNTYFTFPKDLTVDEGWVGIEVDWPGYADTWWPSEFTTLKTYLVDEWDRVWDDVNDRYVDGVYEIWMTQVLPLARISWKWKQVGLGGTYYMPDQSDVVSCVISIRDTVTNEVFVDELEKTVSRWGESSGFYLPPIGNYALDIDTGQYSSFWGPLAAGTVPTYTWATPAADPYISDSYESPTFWLPNSFDADVNFGNASLWSAETTASLWWCDATGGEEDHPFPGAGWNLLGTREIDPAAPGSPWECEEGSVPAGTPHYTFTLPDFETGQTMYLLQTWGSEHGMYHYHYTPAHERHMIMGSTAR
jgi:hypothetical protein